MGGSGDFVFLLLSLLAFIANGVIDGGEGRKRRLVFRALFV